MIGLLPRRYSISKSAILAGLMIAGLLAYAGPQFLRMPITNDAQMYDLQARLLENGGILYQDILEPNLPGVVWLHGLVRQVGGWSSETLRLFDLLVFTGVLCLAERWFARVGWSPESRLWFLIAATWYYVSQSEWCHCQRDLWLLLPVMGALTLRRTVTLRQQSAQPVFWLGLCEGLLWGCGVWLKPHVILPAALVWLVSNLVSRPGKRILPDLAGLLIGGLLVGGIGVGWMIHQDCWPAFWETVQHWNPRYFAAGREHWTLPRFLGTAWRLSPWFLLHMPAAVIAGRSILAVLRERPVETSAIQQAMLSACYLGWATQAFFLQHLFDYIHAPIVLLALLIVADSIRKHYSILWCKTLTLGFVALAVMASPLFTIQRASSWWNCVTIRSNPALKQHLAVLKNPQWEDLDRVANYLQQQSLGNTDVCCMHSDLVSLYNRLDLLPPTRFVYVQELIIFFPDRKAAIIENLQQTPHRFIVSDMASAGLTEEQQDKLLSTGFQAALIKPATSPRSYPWGHPVVFRSGQYLVHRKLDR